MATKSHVVVKRKALDPKSDRQNGYYRVKSDSAKDPYAAAHRICEGAEPTTLSHFRDVSKSSQHGGHGKCAHNLTRVSASGDSIFLSQIIDHNDLC